MSGIGWEHMRFVATLVVCGGLSVMVAGCDQTDKVFFKKGIGTELNAGDVAATTDAQNNYIEYICEQAGLQPGLKGVCGPEPFNPMTWQLFVQAGMNDIDQRCDAYLSWLDYVRRSKEPTLTELAQASTATTVIMDRAGVGAGPIAIAAAAYGFAIQTFTNVTSRLILEVDHSTVQAVVLSHQKEFREELFGSVDKRIPPVVIASKPAAIYALRSYLRLCMPMTIETQINSIMTTFSRGGTRALNAGEPMITAATVGVRPTIIRDVKAPMTRVVAIGTAGEPTDPAVIASIRKALCLSESGGLDDAAHKRLGVYLDSIKQPHSERFLAREMIFMNRLINKKQTATCSVFGAVPP